MAIVTSCASLKAGPTLIECPQPPVWERGELDRFSDVHADWLAGVVREGINLGCWEIGDDFSVEPERKSDGGPE